MFIGMAGRRNSYAIHEIFVCSAKLTTLNHIRVLMQTQLEYLTQISEVLGNVVPYCYTHFDCGIHLPKFVFFELYMHNFSVCV
jgi:hypothetical protein